MLDIIVNLEEPIEGEDLADKLFHNALPISGFLTGATERSNWTEDLRSLEDEWELRMSGR